jgi:hypothetical protein
MSIKANNYMRRAMLEEKLLLSSFNPFKNNVLLKLLLNIVKCANEEQMNQAGEN